MSASKASAEQVRSLLNYDIDSGIFTRRSQAGRYKAGSRVGYDLKGAGRSKYTKIEVAGIEYSAAALAWLYVHGHWPAGYIRFRDGNGTNIALNNLALDEKRSPVKSLPSSMAANRVRELLSYDPESGQFRTLTNRGNVPAGSVLDVTPLKHGHLSISVDGKQVLAHRLAWLLMTGAWPSGVIDHIDGDPANNKFANLRDVSQAVNSQNQRRARIDNRSGVLGAHFRGDTGRYSSKISTGDGVVSLGCFETAEQAHDAYVVAKRALHKGCTL